MLNMYSRRTLRNQQKPCPYGPADTMTNQAAVACRQVNLSCLQPWQQQQQQQGNLKPGKTMADTSAAASTMLSTVGVSPASMRVQQEPAGSKACPAGGIRFRQGRESIYLCNYSP